MTDDIAFLSTPVAAPKSGGSWIKLVPSGRFKARDGRTFTLSDARAVVAASQEWHGETDIVIDYEHQTFKTAENGKPAPAAGWVKKLEARADGVWGLVEWTPEATAMLKARHYRYLSPALRQSKDGDVMLIVNAGLTNHPALKELPALASAHIGDRQTMTDLKTIRAALELPETASADDIVQEIATLKSGDNDKATKAFEMLAAELIRERRSSDKERFDRKVDDAISRGVLLPSQRDWAIGLCSVDESRFDTFVEKAGTPLAYLQRGAFDDETVGKLSARDGNVPHGMETEVARQLGIDPSKMSR